MSSRIIQALGKGIYRLESGSIRAKVSFGNRKRGGQSREKVFPKGTSLREMIGWQRDELATLRRLGTVVAKGTLAAGIAQYLETLANDHSRQREKRYELGAWLPRFGDRHRHSITSDEISDQVTVWQQQGVAASTQRHRLSSLGILYTSLDGDDGRNPVKNVKRPLEPDPTPNGVPLVILQRVLDEFWYRTGTRNRGWKTLARALVLAHTGMRPSQLKRLKVQMDIEPQIVTQAAMIQIPKGKGGKTYDFPLTEDLRNAFRLFIRVEAAGKFCTSSFYKSWILSCNRAGVPKFNPYRMRHTFGTELRRGGTDLADIQALMGHKNSKTTQRYASVSPEKLSAAGERLSDAWRKARGHVAGAHPQVRVRKVSSD
jgi:integrase